jgi:arylsulfatase A
METDHATVRVLETLDRLGIADNTLVFFTTDNGCSPAGEYRTTEGERSRPELFPQGTQSRRLGRRPPRALRRPLARCDRTRPRFRRHHLPQQPDGHLRGDPRREAPGRRRRGQLLHPARAARREDAEPTHPFVIHHSISGRFAIRKGDWKFIAAKGSGGWSKGDDGKPSQLYNMATDRKESNNLVDVKPEIAAELTKLLETAVANGRTTPGPKQKNDAKVVIWKDRQRHH